MIHLRAGNSATSVHLEGLDKYAAKKIGATMREILSYEVPSAEWSDKYKTGVWDGKISLYNGYAKEFPAGLTDFVLTKLKEKGIEFTWVDERPLPWQNATYSADYGKNREPRYYQVEMGQLAKACTRGIFAIGTGGGKTIGACNVIVELGCKPVLVIVPSTPLLRQTATGIEECVRENGKPVQVGRAGGGQWDIKENGINVSTYHSALSAYGYKYLESKHKLVYDEFSGEKLKKSIPQLEEELKAMRKSKNLKGAKKIEGQILDKKTFLDNKRQMQRLVETCQVLIIDECHIAVEIIERLSMLAKNAYYKLGQTATSWREDNQEIRMQGALGGILLDVSSSELIKKGYLVKPTILMFKLDTGSQCKGWQECYNKDIIDNDQKNQLIKKLAEAAHAEGLPTVILVERRRHGTVLESLIDGAVFVPGKEKGDDDPDAETTDYRKRMLDKLAKNEQILIATQWIYTGVNCPEIQFMVLAGSASSSITTYQQVGRALRLSPGKHYAIIADFVHKSKYFKDHSLKRKKTYGLESEYEVKVIKMPSTNK